MKIQSYEVFHLTTFLFNLCFKDYKNETCSINYFDSQMTSFSYSQCFLNYKYKTVWLINVTIHFSPQQNIG